MAGQSGQPAGLARCSAQSRQAGQLAGPASIKFISSPNDGAAQILFTLLWRTGLDSLSDTNIAGYAKYCTP